MRDRQLRISNSSVLKEKKKALIVRAFLGSIVSYVAFITFGKDGFKLDLGIINLVHSLSGPWQMYHAVIDPYYAMNKLHWYETCLLCDLLVQRSLKKL